MKPTIRFANRAQEILFECELKGQISDGFWENALPHDHYKMMCAAHVSHAHDADATGAVVGKNFRPMRKYDFTNRELLDIVGQRMINFVKVYMAFPELSYDNHWDYACETDKPISEELGRNVEIWLRSQDQHASWLHSKAQAVLLALKVKTVEELVEKLKAADAVNYTMTDLRRDLKEMKEIVNS